MTLKDTDTRALDLLRALEAEPHASQRQLASEIGLSLSRTNYVLRSLIEKGWVKADNFSQNPNKLGYVYLLTPAGITEKMQLTRRFLIRKYAEYDAIKDEIARLEAELSGKGL